MNHPKISIIIPTYNRSTIIVKTLESVRVQTFKDWECIVVDDGSTDNTRSVVNEFIKQDKRFSLINNNRKKGAQGARNTGLLKSSGKFILFFDSDNIMLPDRLLKQVVFLENNPLCDVCNCYSHWLNEKNEIIGAFKSNVSGNILYELLSGSAYIDYNNGLIKKDSLDKIGLLDENCPSSQEWDTHIRLAKTARYGTVPEFLVLYYKRDSGRISNNLKIEFQGLAYIYAKHRKLWLDMTGKRIYLTMLYSLSLRIATECRVSQKEQLQKEIYSLLPELMDIPVGIKTNVLMKELLFQARKQYRMLWGILTWPILLLKGDKSFSIKKIRKVFCTYRQSFLNLFIIIKHAIVPFAIKEKNDTEKISKQNGKIRRR